MFSNRQDAKTEKDLEDPAHTAPAPDPSSAPPASNNAQLAGRCDDLTGVTFADKYEIIGLVGTGGMSSVYKARNLLTKKIMALKLMHAHLLGDSNAVRRFQQEATAAGRLNHPNSISVWDMGVREETGQPYLLMDFLEGKSLARIIEEEGSIESSRCLHIFRQTCSALDDAHNHGILHRDLKPSNVMLITQGGDSDFVKVVDYGIAKVLPEGGTEGLKLTHTGDVFGSPLYMSPEQCHGSALDARSDIYSMGCLMYEALCGRPPLQGSNIMDTMHKQLNIEPESLKLDGSPAFTSELNKLVMKALAKNPSDRQQSMSELQQEIDTATEIYMKRQKRWRPLAGLEMFASDNVRRIKNLIGQYPRRAVVIVAVLCLSIGFAPLLYWRVQFTAPPMESRQFPVRYEDTGERLKAAAQSEGNVHDPRDMASLAIIDIKNNLKNHKVVPQNIYTVLRAAGALHKYAATLDDVEHARKAYQLAMVVEIALREKGIEIDREKAEAYDGYARCTEELGDTLSLPSAISLSIQAANIMQRLGFDPRESAVERMRALRLMDMAEHSSLDKDQKKNVLAQHAHQQKILINLLNVNQELIGLYDPEHHNFLPKIVFCISQVAQFCYRSGDYPSAAKFGSQAMVAWHELGNKYNEAAMRETVGMAQMQIGDMTESRGDRAYRYSDAEKFFERAEQLLRSDSGANDAYLVDVLYNKSDALARLNQGFESFWVANMQARMLQSQIAKKNSTQ